mmetsp:Transcript_16294/g.36659  ORF Transcript_16294/g.36659 Transcript_16294/m.36659 type:complete len:85 (-) Transcript_16294:1964-2218(-)
MEEALRLAKQLLQMAVLDDPWDMHFFGTESTYIRSEVTTNHNAAPAFRDWPVMNSSLGFRAGSVPCINVNFKGRESQTPFQSCV